MLLVVSPLLPLKFFFVFKYCSFDFNVFGVGLLEFILIRTFCVSWAYVNFSFTKLGKFVSFLQTGFLYTAPFLLL